MTAFGIDLGTTYSCIAYVDDSGRSVVVRNQDSETTPSVVWFEGPQRVTVGQLAKDSAVLHPDRVVSLIKREMGNPDWQREFDGERHTPETVSALVLRSVVESVQQSLGITPEEVVITVPAYFGVAEREATRRAGEIAGLKVLDLVPEPVAAALHYDAIQDEGERTVLVFDLGGGTFDTTVIRLAKDKVEVVCTDGDHKLGGADWDEILREHLLELFTEANPSVDAGADEQFLQDLQIQAEQLKRDLSTAESRRRVLRCGDGSATVEVSRSRFQELTAHLLEQTMAITERTITTAKERGVDRFDDVYLVGGSSKMPAVAESLRERFGFTPVLRDPDLAVAKGAAMYSLIKSIDIELGPDADGAASSEASKKAAIQLNVPEATVHALAARQVTTVVPRAFGVRVVDTNQHDREFVDHVLHANDPLPASPAPQTYATLVDNQPEILIEVREQAGAAESEELDANNEIGQGVITGLPPLRAGSPVQVTFSMDSMGTLRVHGVEPTSGKAVDVVIEIGGMTDEERDRARRSIGKYNVES